MTAMTIEPKNTVIAYRCPYCGKGVISNVGVFALTAEKIALRCTCKRSELLLEYRSDGKVSVTAPCTFCPNPHSYLLSKDAIFAREYLTLDCPYIGTGNVFIGGLDHVKTELSRTELELLDAMDEYGVESFEEAHKKNKNAISDKQVLDIILYVINELDEEGRIECRCDEHSGDYSVEITDEGVCVTCNKCGASVTVPINSYISAHDFLNTDSLKLS